MSTLAIDYDADSLSGGVGDPANSWSPVVGSPVLSGSNCVLGAAINGHKAVNFNGSNSELITSSFTAIPQPCTWFMVLRINTSDLNYIMGGPQRIFQQGVCKLYAGAVNATGGRSEEGVHIFRIRFDGVSSSLFVDGQEFISGENSGSDSLTQIVLGHDGSSTFHGSFDAARIKIFSAMTGPEAVAEESSLAAAYGITLCTDGSVARSVISGTSGVTGQAYVILVPKAYNDSDPRPLAVYHVGGDATAANVINDVKLCRVVDAFLARGMIVCASDMHSWTQWGNSVHVADIDDLISIVDAGNTCAGLIPFGSSRGGQSSLVTFQRLAAMAWLGLEPVCSLDWAFVGSFTAEITSAYGITGASPNTYAEKTTGKDPILFSSGAFAGKYLHAAASAGDSIVSKASNTDLLMATASTAAEASILSTSGNHGDFSTFQYADSYAFIGRVISPPAPTRRLRGSMFFA